MASVKIGPAFNVAQARSPGRDAQQLASGLQTMQVQLAMLTSEVKNNLGFGGRAGKEKQERLQQLLGDVKEAFATVNEDVLFFVKNADARSRAASGQR